MIEQTVASAASASARVTNGLDILLVEDSRANQLLMSSLLKNVGYQVTLAENGLVAIQLIQQRLPAVYDLILMDLQMPELDGYSATKIIRGLHNAAAKVPIFAISASDSVSDHEQCYAVGMQACVPKPFEIDKLVGKIEQFVQQDESIDIATAATTAEDKQRVEAITIIDEKTLSEMQQSLSQEAMLRMINTFLAEAEQRTKNLHSLTQALIDSPENKEPVIDWLSIQRELHTLKSLSGSFAAKAMFELSINMEQQAKQEGFEQNSFAELIALLQKTKLAFIELGLH